MKDEAGWLACADPNAMLEWLTARDTVTTDDPRAGRVLASDRKLRLFACAVARDESESRGAAAEWALETAEGHAEGAVSHEQLSRVRAHFSLNTFAPLLSDLAVEAAAGMLRMRLPGQGAGQWNVEGHRRCASLLREVVGSPFRPVRLCESRRPHPSLFWSGWLTPPVLAVARAAYDDRDFALLPLVADALVDAGCDHEGLLGHLRGFELADENTHSHHWIWVPLKAPHVRGCWAADLLLGME